jgi:hypothetical protein
MMKAKMRGTWSTLLALSVSLLTVIPCRSDTGISNTAYLQISQQIMPALAPFYVYQDQDSGLNHGYPSGFFADPPATLSKLHVDTGCIDDPISLTGCTTDPGRLDRVRGTILRVTFDPLSGTQFAGVNIEEPQNYGANPRGVGYDLRGATQVIFDVRTPTPGGAWVRFNVGGQGHDTPWVYLRQSSLYTTMTVSLASLNLSTADLANVHLLFGIGTNASNAPNGAIILLDNIRFDPAPTSQQSVLGFPTANQTFGALPLSTPDPGRVPFPADQVNRNLTTIYESSLVLMTLLQRGTASDLVTAKEIANSFDYALHHDNHGDPIPTATDGSVGLHNGYSNGDIALHNDQGDGQGKAGDVRLAGFSCAISPNGYCLVLDGATGGNNAFAILALIAAFRQFQDVRYLNDARMIGRWIVGNLTDTTQTGYGGYYLGYPDQGVVPPKPLQTGKSVENNADIFAAFTQLAVVERNLGNVTAAAAWDQQAAVAGDFVMAMYDSVAGRFNAGTVPVGTPASAGISPSGPQRSNDVINTFDFLDSNTFTTMAMAASPRYHSRIDWHRPIQYALNTFKQTVQAGGQTYQGFDIVANPTAGPNGIAWEFTGQMVAAMRFIDHLYFTATFASNITSYLGQIRQAQLTAPFGNGQGLVASTVQNGDLLAPLAQCLSTPFQAIAERVGLAATTWAIQGDRSVNLFLPYTSPNLFLQHRATGDVVYWQLNGASLANSGYIQAVPDLNWKIVGTADLFHAGNTDLIWQNHASGDIVWWDINGAIVASGYISTVSDRNWTIVATTDLFHNGDTDLIWQNTATGAIVYWELNAGALVGSGYLTTLSDLNWQIVAATDLFHDGNTDLVWQNRSSGDIVYWKLNGTTLLGSGYIKTISDLNWKIVGVTDLNRDGNPDLLWQNSASGDIVYWELNGASIVNSGYIKTISDLNWKITGVH